MKKTKLSTISLALALATPVFGADDNAMTLVYPAPAAEIELDNSTPAKRTTPPTNRRRNRLANADNRQIVPSAIFRSAETKL